MLPIPTLHSTVLAAMLLCDAFATFQSRVAHSPPPISLLIAAKVGPSVSLFVSYNDETGVTVSLSRDGQNALRSVVVA